MSLFHAMNKVRFPRSLITAMLVVVVGAAGRSHAAGAAPLANGDDLFTNSLVPHLQLEISREGMDVLEKYRQVWGRPRRSAST
jgi:hypothetical protein